MKIKNDDKVISIIVPVYNTEDYLEEALESLERQKYKNIQVIMVDDGSNDGSALICKKFALRDPRFEYIYQENKGVSAARNNGLRHVRGDYIGFCDSDDWVDDDMYERMLYHALKEGADIVICSYVKEECTRKKEGNKEKDYKIEYIDSLEAIKELHITQKFTGFSCTKLFSRDILQDIYYSEEITITEDTLVCMEAFERAKIIVYDNTPYYHYRMRKESASNCEFKESYWTVQEASRRMVVQMKRLSPSDVIYPQCRLVRYNLRIANKLYDAGLLDQESYERIKIEINNNYSREVANLIVNDTLKESVEIFIKGREEFIEHMKKTEIGW